MELTLREYATSRKISYEAARQSFVLHEGSDLVEGIHFRKSGKKRILLQEGIEVMNRLRSKPPLPIADPEEVGRIKAENETLQSKITELEGELSAAAAENASLRLQIEDLTGKLDKSKDALIDSLFRIQNLQGRLIEATTTEQKDAQDARRGVFARIFGRN